MILAIASGPGTVPSHRRIDRRIGRPDPLGNVVGRCGADFEQSQEQGSAGSTDENVATSFEQGVSRILAAFPFLSARLPIFRGAHHRTPFAVAFGGLHPSRMNSSI